MKAVLLTAFLVLALGFVARSAHAAQARKKAESLLLDSDAILHAIADVESGNNPHAVGQAGERGRCQFTRSTWHIYSREPFDSWAGSRTPHVARVERAHLHYLETALRMRGLTPTPELVGAAWRHGAELASAHRNDSRSIRIGHLYRDYVAGQR